MQSNIRQNLKHNDRHRKIQAQSSPNQQQGRKQRRGQNDMKMFKQIFVMPKQQVLKQLKSKKQIQQNFSTARKNHYDKILNIYDQQRGKLVTVGSTQKKQITLQDIQKGIQVVNKPLDLKPQPKLFFQEHIQVQPPDMPNASVASTLTPGNGYAPSIPLTHALKQEKHNIKDLLLRAKAGMYANDIQKQAHLSFFLGAVYQSNREYSESVKFYRKFLACSNSMQDRIGMALGANRIAISEFNRGNFTKSVTFHQKNLKYSDSQNSFAGHYNLGICFRRLKKYNEAIQSFQKGLQWSRQRDQFQSQCLSHGQLGMTYKLQIILKLFIYQNCHQFSKKIKNPRLQLDTLLQIIRLNADTLQQQSQISAILLNNSLQCSKTVGDKRIYGVSVCNLGVFYGNKKFQESLNNIAEQQQDQFQFVAQEDKIILIQELLTQ